MASNVEPSDEERESRAVQRMIGRRATLMRRPGVAIPIVAGSVLFMLLLMLLPMTMDTTDKPCRTTLPGTTSGPGQRSCGQEDEFTGASWALAALAAILLLGGFIWGQVTASRLAREFQEDFVRDLEGVQGPVADAARSPRIRRMGWQFYVVLGVVGVLVLLARYASPWYWLPAALCFAAWAVYVWTDRGLRAMARAAKR